MYWYKYLNSKTKLKVKRVVSNKGEQPFWFNLQSKQKYQAVNQKSLKAEKKLKISTGTFIFKNMPQHKAPDHSLFC